MDLDDFAEILPHWNIDYILDRSLKELKNPFPTNHPDIHEIKSNLENLENLRMFIRYKDLIFPLTYHYYLQIYEKAPIMQRPKLEADFSNRMKKYRQDEMILMKLEKCLIKGQIDRFKRICDSLIQNRFMRSPLVPAAQDLKTKKRRRSKKMMLHFESLDISTL